MITKTKLEPSQSFHSMEAIQPSTGRLITYESSSLEGGTNTISYQDGPKYEDHRLNWKKCDHTRYGRQHGTLLGGIQETIYNRNDSYRVVPYNYQWPTVKLPDIKVDRGALANALRSQIDLNTSDAVLLYSGILQAVPLVGGCFKFVSIMNKAARKLKKDFLRKPFTTVVKSMISLDFIDRFVVSPTIDDARKFLDASNYVVRVMQTASERNVGYTALRSDVTNASESVVSTGYTNYSGSSGQVRWKLTTRRQSKCSAFMLCKLTYNRDAIDPIKLWAARVGLTRPLDSVWDLVPFSFVIDYFTRAGDFISGLSDQMSSQEGLTGRIGEIRDLWVTASVTQDDVFEPTSYTVPWRPSQCYSSNIWLGQCSRETSRFVRNRIEDPFSFLSSTIPGEDDFFQLSLSQTRVRTLLELIIQAKA